MYQQTITRDHRTAIILVINQSECMGAAAHPSDGYLSPAQTASQAVDELLYELIERARRSDGLHDYYDIAVLGYSGQGVQQLLSEQGFTTVGELDRRPCCVTSRVDYVPLADGRVIRRQYTLPTRIHPRAEGRGSAVEALAAAQRLLDDWCAQPQHADSFPPVVIHITGESDMKEHRAEFLKQSRMLRAYATRDGEVLLMNLHVSAQNGSPRILFPTPKEPAATDLLAKASSLLPACFDPAIRSLRGDDAGGPYLAYGCNMPIGTLAGVLKIGTISGCAD